MGTEWGFPDHGMMFCGHDMTFHDHEIGLKIKKWNFMFRKQVNMILEYSIEIQNERKQVFIVQKRGFVGSLMGFHDQGKELNDQGIELYGQKVGYHEVRLFTVMWY